MALKLVDSDHLLVVQQSRLTSVNLTTLGTLVLSPTSENTEFLTTFVVYNGAAWIVEGQLDHFLGIDMNPPMLPFRVVRVPLTPTL